MVTSLLKPYNPNSKIQHGINQILGVKLDYQEIGQKLAPDATQKELQAFRDARIAVGIAAERAYQDTLELTGNPDIAEKKLAKTIFDVGPRMMEATPEGQSFNRKASIRSQPFKAGLQ